MNSLSFFSRSLLSCRLAAAMTIFCLTTSMNRGAVAEPPPLLWDNAKPVPRCENLTPLNGVRFSVIKAFEPDVDGYPFLHGVALCQHKGKLYASFGHNQGKENTATEECRYRVSEDDGRTWGPVLTMDDGKNDPNVAVSHGVFLSHQGQLWAFNGGFTGFRGNTFTKAYQSDESTGKWTDHGVIVREGFWPMQEPIRMEDGNWIMAGTSLASPHRAIPAVAISHGNDFLKWDVIVYPEEFTRDKELWGESTVIVDGSNILNIARFGAEAKALVSISKDYGKTWTPTAPSNLPMVTSKPYAGTLSNGQRYLICTTTADSGGRRSPLTIAVSRPGEDRLCRVFMIRDAQIDSTDGIASNPKSSLSYPYAIESDGHLYVGYSNDGGRGQNVNNAELAVIPIGELAVTD